MTVMLVLLIGGGVDRGVGVMMMPRWGMEDGSLFAVDAVTMFVGGQDHLPGADTKIARAAAGGEHANERRKGDPGLEAL